MSPLRARMIEDMSLAGLADATQKAYIQAMRRLAAHYRRSPDLLSEEEVRCYLLGLRQRGSHAARSRSAAQPSLLLLPYPRSCLGIVRGKKDRLATAEAAA